MGQVSLPVLSRKGKYDNWNYNWISFKNYSFNFNEDLFLKRFLFLFFMYGISSNKNFLPIFFGNPCSKSKKIQIYNLTEFTTPEILNFFKIVPHNKFYISKIFLCRYISWVYVYLYVYSVSNLRIKTLNKKIKLKFFSKHIFYQTFLTAKNRYVSNMFI